MGLKTKRGFVLGFFALVVGVLSGCTPTETKGRVAEALAKASNMTEEQLKAAALEEIGTGKLSVRTQTSGIRKALPAFKAKYGIDYNEDAEKTMKDYQLYTALDVVATGKYYTDMVMIQDARSLQQYMAEGLLVNYIPKDIPLAEGDKEPQASLYFNKLFLWNKTIEGFTMTNVWQLAGSADDEGHIDLLSFQSPATENINMNFLLTLTAPESVAKLKAAYKLYYGVDYVEDEEFPNIGFKYIKEFLKNVSRWHTSDTSTIRDDLKVDVNGTVFYGAFAKYKDLISGLDGDVAAAEAVMAWDTPIEGFKGFLYKMYTPIPSTAKYPYAAALFARYLLTEEGFNAGWGGQYGYYSPNAEVPIHTGDKPLSYWKENCLVEDGEYLATVKNSLISFVQSNL